jgi:hypothetical protein
MHYGIQVDSKHFDRVEELNSSSPNHKTNKNSRKIVEFKRNIEMFSFFHILLELISSQNIIIHMWLVYWHLVLSVQAQIKV